jgi:hypothetical protein
MPKSSRRPSPRSSAPSTLLLRCSVNTRGVDDRPGFEDMIDFNVYAICGDGCIMEGSRPRPPRSPAT